MNYTLGALLTGSLYVAVTLAVWLKPLNSLDTRLTLWVTRINRLRVVDEAAIFLTRYGRFYTWGLVDLALLLMRLWTPFIELTMAMGIAYIIGGVTRLMVKRIRPYEAGYGKPILAASGYSYPSGHAAIVFSGASVMLLSIGGLVSLILLTEALLTAASRIYLNAHYLTDVIGGALLGLTAALTSASLTPILINTLT